MIEVKEFRERGLSTTEKIALLAIGSGIGATLALLLAPKRGEDLRGGIANVTRNGWARGTGVAHEIGEHVGEYYQATKSRAAELYHTAGTGARQVTNRQRGTLTAAIEAGKQAYWAEKRRTEAGAILRGRAAYPYELGDDKQ